MGIIVLKKKKDNILLEEWVGLNINNIPSYLTYILRVICKKSVRLCEWAKSLSSVTCISKRTHQETPIHSSIHPFSNHHFSCTQAVGGCPSCHRVMAASHPGQVGSLSQGHIEMFLASGRKLEFLERTLAETGGCKFHTVIWTWGLLAVKPNRHLLL